MISNKLALEQTTRLKALRYFPSEAMAQKELTKTLVACCATEQEARRLVDWLIANCEEVPTPKGIREASGVLKDRAREQNTPRIPPAPKCTKCFGSDWEIVFSLHTREGVGGKAFVRKEKLTKEQFDEFNATRLDPQVQMVYSGARRCGCGFGQQPS